MIKTCEKKKCELKYRSPRTGQSPRGVIDVKWDYHLICARLRGQHKRWPQCSIGFYQQETKPPESPELIID